ncbi:MAG TPA: CrcB family protein [Kofleriaceae bacterium]|nr:CrcB family protein [Kofleriaceae bacterium]
MLRVLLVFGAGGAGCVARYLIALWVGPRSFPYATLIVNLVGSFLIALILEASLRVASFSPNLRLALTTGFMGGLTTYSSFNYETSALAANGSTGRALINVGATLIGCVLAGLAGLWLARRLT